MSGPPGGRLPPLCLTVILSGKNCVNRCLTQHQVRSRSQVCGKHGWPVAGAKVLPAAGLMTLIRRGMPRNPREELRCRSCRAGSGPAHRRPPGRRSP
jgi:hypothetical protein